MRAGGAHRGLVERAGAKNVAAADPSEPFVAAATERAPGADVRLAAAEELPWEDDRFDAALSQLVVNFMRDADAGVSEMRRVVRPGGVVAACTWSYGEDMEMLRSFWASARRSTRAPRTRQAPCDTGVPRSWTSCGGGSGWPR